MIFVVNTKINLLENCLFGLPLAQLRRTQITVNSLLVIGKSRSDNEWTSN